MTALRDWASQVSPARAGETPPGTVKASTARAELQVGAERQRIASELHDEVGPLLFAMSCRARLARELHAADPVELLATIEALEVELQEAHRKLRGVISGCAPTEPSETVPVATQRDLDAFADRTGLATHLLVDGPPIQLPTALERAALSCLRQALFNIERHAKARTVVVTLDYRPDRVCLVVQDDGLGLATDFEPQVVPAKDHHWGFSSMARQVERLGGSVRLRGVEGGGAQLRVQLPLEAPGPDGTPPNPTYPRASPSRP
jgi:signal transduction histidine kinase